jgi:hypothetical protein
MMSNKKVGDRQKLPCLSHDCKGSIEGVFGGSFYQGETKVYQYLQCTCNTCSNSWPEVFEFFSEYRYDIGDRISFTDPDEDDISYSWGGFGYPVAEIDDVDHHVNNAISEAKHVVNSAISAFELEGSDDDF